jgi:hypothetical protein
MVVTVLLVLQVEKMSGGITNVLAKLIPPTDSGLNSVALRVFGDKTDELIDRRHELMVLLHLNAAGFGAPVSSSVLMPSHQACRAGSCHRGRRAGNDHAKQHISRLIVWRSTNTAGPGCFHKWPH